ncbi:AAA family ATPase [Halonatronum saccharophilum]|uniref:AAA family ATPase n=1 Tax=Halonatronum saccharophilum TaxID=150060 RepID=UPI0004ACED71|nr:AAA family ATPase [Halonatronum saccharophilum]
MEIIKSVEIYNFQSHKDTKIDFDKGLNVITGPSDQGKSAIIRAIRWVLYNEPRGDDFIRHGHKECHVGVELGSGYKIIRKKTPSKNRYILVEPGGEEHIFERIGSGVPEEILNIHRMRKVQLDNKDEISLNMDFQLEGAFLLTDTGSTRAKVLGRLINVHLVDLAIRNTKNEKNRLGIRTKDLDEELKKDKKSLEEFSHLDEMKEDIDNKKELLARLKDTQSKLSDLYNCKEKLSGIDGELNSLKLTLDKLGFVEQLDNIYNTLTQKHKRLLEGEELLKNKTELTADYKKNDELLSKLEGIEEGNKLYIELIDKHNRFKLTKRLADDYKVKEKRIKNGKRYLANFSNLDQLEGLYDKIEVLEDRQINYNRLYKGLDSIKKSIAKEEEVINITKGVKEVKKIAQKVGPDLERRLNKLRDLKQKLKRVDLEIKREESFLKQLPKADDAKEVKDNLKGSLSKLVQLSEINDKNKGIFEKIDGEKKDLDKLNSNIEFLAEKYSRILKDIGRCPTCFEEIEEVKIDKIVKELKGDYYE